MTPASDTIKFNMGVPVQFCPKWTEGKSIQSRYPGERVMFTTVDSRKIFLDGDEARTLEDAMRRYQIRPGEDFVRVTREKYKQGSILRVERVPDEPDEPGTMSVPKLPERPPAPAAATYPASLEGKLTQSVELARAHGAAAFITPPAGEVLPQTPIDHLTTRLAAAYVSAIEAVASAQQYAKSRHVDVTFTSEDVRATAISAFIQGEKLLLERGR